MQQCQKCKTWVESKDITTGGCVNCNSRSVISNGEDVVTGDDLWAEWDRKVQEAAEVIQLLCATRYTGSKKCTGCPLSKDGACIANNPGEIPKDWILPGQVKTVSFEPGNPGMSYVVIQHPCEEKGKYPGLQEQSDGSYLWKDAVGGVHGEGIGYNPQGVFCGECTRETCEGCKHRDAVK